MTNMNPREEKGKQIASRHDLHRISDNFYHVKSQTTKREYNVVKTNNSWQCDCPDHIFRHVCCKHDKIKKFGIRHNKSGDIQRLICDTCHKTFSINVGFAKMRNKPQLVTSALQLYFTGESLRSIQKYLKLQGVTVTHKTIYMWI